MTPPLTAADLKLGEYETAKNKATPIGVRMADVQPERVGWLWSGRIPRGKITVLDGDPGLGKSAITLDLAARVSTGAAMPDGTLGVLGGVVLASAEDDLADTIRPRLDAAGADCRRIIALRMQDWCRLDDIDRLREAIRQTEAVLLVIDPVMAYLGADTDSHRDQDVRVVLALLKELAAETGIAIVLVRHLNKSSAGNPLYRGGGSIGIIGAARAGLVVGRDPEDAERRVLAATKMNLAAEPPSIAYRTVAPDSVVRIEWLGVSAVDAAALMAVPASPAERGELSEALDWLRDRLAAGSVPVRDVVQEARAAGISPRTLERARGRLGVKSKNAGKGTPWRVSLPVDHASQPNSANCDNLAESEKTPVIPAQDLTPPTPPRWADSSPNGGVSDGWTDAKV